MATVGTGNGAMSVAMAEDVMKTSLAALHSELEFVLSDAGIHKDIQAKIVSTGFEDCRLFSKADCGQGEAGIRA